MSISYISGKNLAEIIRQSKGRIESNSFAIVDVRDDDYVGGKIRGSLWKPSEKLQQDYPKNIDAFIHEQGEKECFIFHCHLSQVRGPACAKLFLTRWHEIFKHEKEITVLVLEGGWKQWKQAYASDEDLLEKI